MKQLILFIVVLVVASCGGSNGHDPIILETENRIEFQDHNQKLSYCIGLDHANGSFQVYSSAEMKGKFEVGQIKSGMIDYLSGNELRVPFWAIDSIFNAYLLPGGEVNQDIVPTEDASYAIGMDEAYMLISGLVGRGIDQTIDVEYLLMGVEDGFSSKNPGVPFSEARNEISIYYADLNKSTGEQFLQENSMRDSVVTTESGLQYIVFEKGDGNKPMLTDTVLVHYTGRFLDGREFESTVPSKIPNQMTLLGLIPGWQEGLQLMSQGAQYRFFIPYYLGYGEDGSGVIEPYSTLVYDIELIQISRLK